MTDRVVGTARVAVREGDSMSDPTVLYEARGAVALVTPDRPQFRGE
jgi:hypothetical protein